MLHGLLLNSNDLIMQILTFGNKVIHFSDSGHLAHLTIAVLHGQTPIYLISVLNMIVLLHQFVDSVIDAALRNDDIVALF